MVGLLVGLLVGTPFILIWYFSKKRASQSLNWPSVPGQVYDSRLVRSQDTESGTTTSAQVSYRYAVAGQQYQSSRVSYAGGKGRADQILARYPVGAQVQVYYDPKKPKAAVLEPGTAGLNVFLYIGIAIIVIVLLASAFRGGSSRSSDADPAEYSHAVELYNQSQFSAAKPLLERLARNGNDNAKVYLGVMFAKGQGVSADFIESLKWFILAGSAGEKNAAEIRKGLNSAQQKEAEARAKAWSAGA